MYVHLGGDRMVLLGDVVAILRADLTRDGPTREMVQSLRARGKLVLLPGGPPRSLVLTVDGAYLSPLSTLALLRRARRWSLGREEDAIGRTERT
ncbi:MAG: extracellular matrix regulator RemB [Bacillota bacterium]